MGGAPGGGGDTSLAGCVDEVGRYYLRDDQTVFQAIGTVNPTLTQMKKKSDESTLRDIIDVASGSRYGCAVDKSGGVWCWPGQSSPLNTYGELGDNLAQASYVVHSATPVQAAVPEENPETLAMVKALQSGSDECIGSINCAIVSGGGLWCWGKGNNTLLNSMASGVRSPVAVPIESQTGVPLTGVDQVSALGDHICVVSDGKVLCWGSNFSGQLGQGDQVTQKYPQQVALGGNAVKVGVGRDTSCALLTDGTMKCWGSNRMGALGVGDPDAHDDGCSFPCKTTPVPITLDGSPLDDIVDLVLGSRSLNTAGFSDVCALRKDGSVWCWGEIMETDVPTPVFVDEEEMLSDAVQISMCASRLMYVTEDGRVMHKEGKLFPRERASVCE